MKEIFSERSLLKFTESGNQILSWTWKHPDQDKEFEIISGYEEKDHFFRSGSYLMFPWVNRHTGDSIRLGEDWISLAEIGSKDANGYPSHGLAYAWERKVVERSERRIRFELIPDDSVRDFDLAKILIHEEYSLESIFGKEVLTLRTSFKNRTEDPFRFCYGYHPYFRMNSSQPPCILRSNLLKQIPLQEDLTPVYPIYGFETDRFSLEKVPALDSLFYGKDAWVTLQVPEDSYQVCVQANAFQEDEIRLSYFQIYTNFSENRIAIEPMSAPGNAVRNGFSLTTLRPAEEKSGSFQILLSGL
ncbi:aldose 1-epimerase [Leptospira sanjuanensis]|uniref:aldose 1-epimerase n=1 Tax=Leptospira sanjuanensis TaxID=2879643 RepID=UPI001EE79B70|nr:aldose 1-epimerase [Leptospira sanjuanensis]MCG6167901.1 aldose 1-epimerase [Leptospira sanjuanensis]